jgi:hypothetical protein
MKITALIDDKLIQEVKSFSGGKNITESLLVALNYYISQKKLQKAMDEIDKEPLQFQEDFVEYHRKRNRNR